jgi:hypothetical protein
LAQAPPPEAQAAAVQGNEVLKAIIVQLLEDKDGKRQFVDQLGLKDIETATDVKKLKLDSALPTYRISLKTLLSLPTGLDLMTVLPKQASHFLYPIKVEENVRISLFVALSRTDQQWLVTEWGNAGLIRRVDEVRKQNPYAKSILRINGLNRYYLIDESEVPFRIIPLDKKDPVLAELGPKLGLVPDQSVKAESILEELQKEANEILELQKQIQLPRGETGPEIPVR